MPEGEFTLERRSRTRRLSLGRPVASLLHAGSLTPGALRLAHPSGRGAPNLLLAGYAGRRFVMKLATLQHLRIAQHTFATPKVTEIRTDARGPRLTSKVRA